MKKMYFVLFLALGVSVIPISSWAFEFGVRGHYWAASLDGSVKVDEGDIIGEKIDFEQDLGIGDERLPALEVFIGGGNHHLSLIYTDVEYSGSNVITRDIVFSGETYSFGSLTTSSIEYQTMDLSYQYDLINAENMLAGFSLGAVFQVKYFNGEVRLQTTGIDEKENFTLPVPMIGLNFHMGILADLLEARVRGTGVSYSGNHIYELLGELSLTPLPFVEIHGGYRTFTIDIDEDEVTFDYVMSGPYIALTIGF